MNRYTLLARQFSDLMALHDRLVKLGVRASWLMGTYRGTHAR